MQRTSPVKSRFFPFFAFCVTKPRHQSKPGLTKWMTGLSVLAVSMLAQAQVNFPGPGYYTSLKNSSSNAYIGFACSDTGGTPALSCGMIPGIGAKGKVLQTGSDPGITFLIQKAPNNGHGANFYNVINTTHKRCLAVGDGVYEASRLGTISSAGYLVAIQDAATMPATGCDYSNDHVQWQIIDNGAGVDFKTNGYVAGYAAHCWGNSGGLIGTLNGTYMSGSTYGDFWVRNAGPACGSAASRIVFGGFTPLPDHILLSQVDSSPVNADGTTTKTLTVTSCKNEASAACVVQTYDTQVVNITVSGVGTLTPAAVTLVNGQATFTIKSAVAGTAGLTLTPTRSSNGYTCSRAGTAGAQTAGASTNVDCQVSFNATSDHIQLSQADTTTRMADGTSTKTVTVSSCSNAMGSACTLLATDTQTVTLTNTGVGTLSAASVTLVGGQATFTVKSAVPGDAKLAASATTTNGYTCTRGGTSGAQTVGAATNIDCMVSFLPPHHIQLSQADSSSVLPDNVATKTVTVTSCSNSNFDTCTTLMGDTQTVTIANLGVGTLSTTTVPLVNGVGTFTVKSGLVGNAQLKVTGSTSTAGYSCTRGNPATAGTDTNADCQVAFSAGTTFDAVEKDAVYPPASRLFTKVAGLAFDVDVLAIDAGALKTGFTGTVDVELINASGGCGTFGDGAKLATTPASYAAYTFTGSGADNGRHTFNFAHAGAVKTAKVRIRSAGQTYCSSDDFSIRPAYFQLSSNPDSSQKVVAGTSFTLSVITKDATGGTMTGFTGNPTFNLDAILDWTSTKIPAGSLTGSFGAMNNGEATGTTFKYSDIGPLSFPAYSGGSSGVIESDFMTGTSDKTNNDCVAGMTFNVPSGGKYGCDVGSTALTTPRFYPDHYRVTTTFTPACGAGGFTYMGQSLGIAANISARNANDAVMTRVLTPTGAAAGTLTWTMPSVVSVVAGNTATDNLNASLTGFPVASSWPSYSTPGDPVPAGGGTVAFSNNYPFTRPAVTAPANPTIYDSFRLTTTLSDPDNKPITVCSDGGTTNGTIGGTAPQTTCTSPTTKVRYGILKVENAYGSDLLDLPVMFHALYWNGNSWQPNTNDTCTAISGANIAIGNRRGQLTASNFTTSNIPTGTITMGSAGGGKAIMIVRRPNPAATGTVDLAVNLGSAANDAACTQAPLQASTPANMPWLRGQWGCGSLTYDRDPTTRIGFGISKSPHLYRREKY